MRKTVPDIKAAVAKKTSVNSGLSTQPCSKSSDVVELVE